MGQWICTIDAGVSRARCLGLGLVMFLATPCMSAADGDPTWDFQLSPYAWLAGLKGDIGTVPGAPPAPVDISPSDVVEDVEATLMLIFNARRGRHGIYTDVFYADIQSDAQLLPPPVDLSLRVQAESTLFSVAYQYAFIHDGPTTAEVFAGARYWRVDNRLRFGGGNGLPAGRDISGSESWTDPLFGIKGSMPLGGSRFYLTGGAAIGGFGLGSDLFYEASAAFGYRWSDAIGTVVGYRRYDVDYEEGDFSYDVTQQGWQLGLTWSF